MADGLTLSRGQPLCFLSFDWMLRERKACRNCACSQIWVRPKRVRGRETLSDPRPTRDKVVERALTMNLFDDEERIGPARRCSELHLGAAGEALWLDPFEVLDGIFEWILV